MIRSSSRSRFLFSFLLVSTAQAVCYTTAQNEAWCEQTHRNRYDCGDDRRCYWVGFNDWSGTCKAKQTCTAATMFQCQAAAQDEAWCGQTQTHRNRYDCGYDGRCYWLGSNDWSGSCKAKETCTDNLAMTQGEKVNTGLLSVLLALMVLIAVFLILIGRAVIPLKGNAVVEEANLDGVDGKSGENEEASGEKRGCCFGCKKKVQEIDEAVVSNENENTAGKNEEEKAVEGNEDAV